MHKNQNKLHGEKLQAGMVSFAVCNADPLFLTVALQELSNGFVSPWSPYLILYLVLKKKNLCK